jgi:hypothetical protein
MSEVDYEARAKEMLRLVEGDHKSTTDYIARVTTLRTATRAVIVPLASALAGLALANHDWIVAVAGIPTVIIGAASEARSDFLLKIAHKRLMRLEYKVQAYLDYLNETGTVADAAKLKLEREIDTYQFGISRSLRGQALRKTLAAAAKTTMFWFYVALIIILVAVSVTVGLMKSNAPQQVESCLITENGGVVRLRELPEAQTGNLELVPCPRK